MKYNHVFKTVGRFFAEDYISFIKSLILTIILVLGLEWWVIAPVTGTKTELVFHFITYSLTLAGFSLAAAIFNMGNRKNLLEKYKLFHTTRQFIISSVFFIGYFAWIGVSFVYESIWWKLVGPNDFTPVGFLQHVGGYFTYLMLVQLGRFLTILGLFFFSNGLIEILDITKLFINKTKK